MILEICANSFESAKTAQEAGAHRIELCEDLSIGGITPSYTLIEKVRSLLTIETHVLIRPRGGDFCYDEDELQQMEKDIAFCKEMGCNGVVSGTLTSEGKLDHRGTQRLIEAARGMEFTFHRAIDVARNPQQLLREIILMGITRVLSSGTKATAEEGLPILQKFQEMGNGEIQIMPGGGITSQNAFLFKKAGFQMVHTSATTKKGVQTSLDDLMQSQSTGNSGPDEIKKILEVLS